MAEQIDFMALIQKAGETYAQNKNTGIQIEQIMDENNAQLRAQMGNMDNVAKADSVITSEKNRFAAETDARKAAAEVAFSSDFRQQGAKTNELAAEIIANYDKANKALETIKSKESVTLLDNPLDYIMNKFTLPADTAEYNHYVRKHNNAENTLNALMDGTSKAAVIAERMQKSTSSEIAAAENDKILATAATAKNELLMRNASFKINGLTTLQSLNSQQLDIAFKLQGAGNEEQRLAMSRESHKLALADHALKRQMLSEQLEQKQDAAKYSAQTMAEYNIGAQKVGGMTYNDPKRFMQMLPMLAKDPDAVSAMLYGQKALYNQANKIDGVVPVAPTAGAAARIYSKSNVQGNEVGTFLSSMYSKFEGQPGMKDPSVLEATVTKSAREQATIEAQMIKSTVPNIYSAPPIGVVIKAAPGIASILETPFFKNTVMPEYAANSKIDIPHDRMISKASEFLKQNPAELNSTAAALSKYYSAAVITNNVTKEYEANMLPNQKNYRADIKALRLTGLGQSDVVDLTNPIVVKTILMKSLRPEAGVTGYLRDRNQGIN